MNTSPLIGFPLDADLVPGLQRALTILRERHPREKDAELLARLMAAGIADVTGSDPVRQHVDRMLRIISCRDAELWYADLVGCLVPYLGQMSGAYKSRVPAGHINQVRFSDAELVDVLPGGRIVPARRVA
jgi:hypothetical protein